MKINYTDKVKSMVVELQNNLFNAHSYFLLHDSIKKLSAPNIVWEQEAKKNFEIMEKFNYFFWLSTEASREIYLLKLAKFFDNDKRSNSIIKIINYIRSNIRHFKNTINDDELKFFEGELSQHSTIIQNLKTYRDQYIAHNQIEPSMIILTIEDTEIITDLLIRILNNISSKIFSEQWSHKHQEIRIFGEMKTILDHLYRFEPYRLKEIKKERQKRLSKYKKKQSKVI